MSQLLIFAKKEFELNARLKNGDTLRQSLECVYKQTGKKPKQLESEEFPSTMSQVWAWFMQLNNARSYSDMCGALPLTYSEILAWRTLTDNWITPFEVSVIKLLDGVAMSAKKEE